ncbi:MAG: replication-relaxation family protein [Chloroflexi bacterium]|nr:replication-relaxation family protein [Chloroflexota bacterium]
MIREQIQRLYFRKDGELASVQAACRRLRILTERGYLTRLRLPVTQGSGPYVYQPGRGALLAFNEGRKKVVGPGARGRRVESIAGLCHGLEVVDFYIAIKEGLESRGGRALVWLGEGEVRYAFTHRGKRLVLSPDAYCLWALGTEEGSFFLEWDRGTESMTRFAEKLQVYEAYYLVRGYHNHVGEMELRPRLLIVAPDERREKKMVDWMARRLGRGEFPSLPTVLVTARDLVHGDVLGPIWRRPGEEQRMRFVD